MLHDVTAYWRRYPQRVVFAGEPVFNLVALGPETGFAFDVLASQSSVGSGDSKL